MTSASFRRINVNRIPRFLIDVDGVLANTIEAALPHARELTEREDLHHDHVTTWAIEDAFGIQETDRERFYARWRLPDFVSSMPLYPGANSFVDALRGLGEVYAVTAPFPHALYWQYEREQWLVKHLGFDRKHVLSTDAKHIVAGDVLIEDKPETLFTWKAHWPNGLAICMSRPYNQAYQHLALDFDHALEQISDYLVRMHQRFGGTGAWWHETFSVNIT
jgi:5'(3')-deoxyribonucleotidase